MVSAVTAWLRTFAPPRPGSEMRTRVGRLPQRPHTLVRWHDKVDERWSGRPAATRTCVAEDINEGWPADRTRLVSRIGHRQAIDRWPDGPQARADIAHRRPCVRRRGRRGTRAGRGRG